MWIDFVSCYFTKFTDCLCVCLVTQSCPSPCYPMNCSPPCPFVHGILQARILEWIAVLFSRGSFPHRTRNKKRILLLAIFIQHCCGGSIHGNSLIISSNFLIVSLGCSLYSIILSANGESFTSSFTVWIPFISFPSLIAMTRTSKTMLNYSDEKGQFCLFPDLRGNTFRFSPLRIMFVMSVLNMAFIILYLSIPILKNFYHTWVLNFVKSFFCIYCDYHMTFIFKYVNMVYHIDWFADIEEFLHLLDKPNLIMMYGSSNVLSDSVC